MIWAKLILTKKDDKIQVEYKKTPTELFRHEYHIQDVFCEKVFSLLQPESMLEMHNIPTPGIDFERYSYHINLDDKKNAFILTRPKFFLQYFEEQMYMDNTHRVFDLVEKETQKYPTGWHTIPVNGGRDNKDE